MLLLSANRFAFDISHLEYAYTNLTSSVQIKLLRQRYVTTARLFLGSTFRVPGLATYCPFSENDPPAALGTMKTTCRKRARQRKNRTGIHQYNLYSLRLLKITANCTELNYYSDASRSVPRNDVRESCFFRASHNLMERACRLRMEKTFM